MEEAPENGKESSHPTHAKGVNRGMDVNEHQKTEAEKVFSELNTHYSEKMFKSFVFICRIRQIFEP
jgi:hypothetical protein